ncbi:MAG: group I intron-associated PD-(D/E)XK endonuclease [bacterium]
MIADLLRAGAQVCLPISEHLPFDLIAVSPSMRELRRVQVRYAKAKHGAVMLHLTRTHADRHGIHCRPLRREEIDAFAIFCPDTNAVYYVLRDEIPPHQRRQFFIRLVRSRNGQTKCTRPAADFAGANRIFGPVAQVDRAGVF